ncbi:MAG: O-antigen ligase family protein [Deltaproteobacteria bacterium]
MVVQPQKVLFARAVFMTVMVIFVAVIPWIVRLKICPIDNNIVSFWSGLQSVNDFYSYYKSIFVVIAGVLALMALGMALFKSNMVLTNTRLYKPLSVYTLLIVASSLCSYYPKVAWLGGPERCEGTLVLLAYLAICFVSINMLTNKSQIRIIAIAFLISSTLLGILGINQYYGFNLISSWVGQNLIIPAGMHYKPLSSIPGHAVYATLYNPNFAGMYFAMVFTFAMVWFFCTNKTRHQFMAGAACCIAFASLLGTSARGAWIGTFLSLALAVWLLRRSIVQKRLPTLLITLSLLVTYLIMNLGGQDNLSDRVGSIGNEMNNSDSDYQLWTPRPADNGAIHGEYDGVEVWMDKKRLILQADERPPLKLCLKDGRVSFFDCHNKKIALGADKQKNWYLRDSKYSEYAIKMKKDLLYIKVGEVALPTLWIINNNDLWFKSEMTALITDIQSHNQTLVLKNEDNESLNVRLEKGKVVCSDRDGGVLPLQRIQGKNCYLIADSRFVDYLLVQKNNILLIDKGGKRIRFVFTDQGVFNLDIFGRKIPVRMAPSIGFKGRETMFSSRGYIWSRTFPLLSDAIWLGHGPDTFFAYFPQNDHIGKYVFLYSAEAIVDKPHNLYLQAWMNTGLLSLLAFIFLFGYYIISSLKLYGSKSNEEIYSVGIACLAAVIAYLISGFMYESNVCVAPVFWGLLGLGIACNGLYRKSTKSKLPAAEG